MKLFEKGEGRVKYERKNKSPRKGVRNCKTV